MILLLATTGLAAPPAELYDLGLVLRGTDRFAAGVGAPSVEYDGGSDTFVLYFESPAPAAEVPAGCANSYRIGRATSVDGVNWTVDPDPVLEPDAVEGSARACSVAQPAVVYDGARWNLFYSASKTPNEGASTNAPSGLGWATSADGSSWEVQAEVLVAFSDTSIGLASAAVANGTLYVVYSAFPDLWMVAAPVGTATWTAPVRVVDHTTLGPWATQWALGPALGCDPTSTTAPLTLLFGADTTENARSLAWASSASGVTWALDADSPLSGGTLDYATVNHWDTLRAGDGHLVWTSRTDPDSGLKAIGAAVTDTRLGEPAPRVCPDPWAEPAGGQDSGDCDCADDTPAECGCAATNPGGSVALAVGVGLAVLGRRRRALAR